ncbi:Flp family type IVb pilin [Vibrio sp. FNV 38]|nr:Flp family type IVb pilin [Vibrio sp. FNV 38]
MWYSMKQFLSDEEGLTAVEYVVGAGLLAIILTVVFANWGVLILQELQTVL